MAVECQAVHAGRCPTSQWSRPLARMRSPRLLTATLGRQVLMLTSIQAIE